MVRLTQAISNKHGTHTAALDGRVNGHGGEVPGGATARGVQDLGFDFGEDAVVDAERVRVNGRDGEEARMKGEDGGDYRAEPGICKQVQLP